ncbi:MAG: methyltransferase domain-containing protein [Planctomycetes bacterium]|nr:methyltransferase domain-containing protein [Planctomycetota bacterium]
MSEQNDLLYGAYGRFADAALARVRAETFGRDIGQNSWITVDEYERFLAWLELEPDARVLEVACGSGGPARHLAEHARCRVIGIDAHSQGIETATRLAQASSGADRVRFEVADVDRALPFEDGAFDAIVCIDAINHFRDRAHVFAEWRRVLRPGGRAVFTDPVVVTGPVTNAELAQRSSIGFFLFVPPGANERMIDAAGLRLVRQEDATENIALVSGRWHAARERHADALRALEGEASFVGVQQFLAVVHRLTTERRLSRFVYVVEATAR